MLKALIQYAKNVCSARGFLVKNGKTRIKKHTKDTESGGRLQRLNTSSPVAHTFCFRPLDIDEKRFTIDIKELSYQESHPSTQLQSRKVDKPDVFNGVHASY